MTKRQQVKNRSLVFSLAFVGAVVTGFMSASSAVAACQIVRPPGGDCMGGLFCGERVYDMSAVVDACGGDVADAVEAVLADGGNILESRAPKVLWFPPMRKYQIRRPLMIRAPGTELIGGDPRYPQLKTALLCDIASVQTEERRACIYFGKDDGDTFFQWQNDTSYGAKLSNLEIYWTVKTHNLAPISGVEFERFRHVSVRDVSFFNFPQKSLFVRGVQQSDFRRLIFRCPSSKYQSCSVALHVNNGDLPVDGRGHWNSTSNRLEEVSIEGFDYGIRYDGDATGVTLDASDFSNNRVHSIEVKSIKQARITRSTFNSSQAGGSEILFTRALLPTSDGATRSYSHPDLILSQNRFQMNCRAERWPIMADYLPSNSNTPLARLAFFGNDIRDLHTAQVIGNTATAPTFTTQCGTGNTLQCCGVGPTSDFDVRCANGGN